MNDLWGIVVPVLVAVIVSVSGAFIVSRSAASPAQMAYVQAVQSRLKVVEDERDEAQLAIPKLEARIAHLETRVRELESTVHERELELVRLYRRLDADEAKINRRG